MKYLITNVIETTTSTGKPMWKTTLKDEQGVDETVNLFDRTVEGATLDGEVYTNDKGYRNFKSTQSLSKGAFLANKKEEQIERAQERKEQSINRAMDRKEESIAWFNSRNLAITFVEKYVCNPSISSVAEAEDAVRKYTEVFFKDWQNWNNQPF